MESITPELNNPSPLNKHKLLGYLFLALVFAGAVALAYWWQYGTDNKQADEITDWKTYRNEEYGFEFKYPKDLEAKEELHKDFRITDGETEKVFDWLNVSIDYGAENGRIILTMNHPGFGLEVVEEKIDDKIISVNNINMQREVLTVKFGGKFILYSFSSDPDHNYLFFADIPKNKETSLKLSDDIVSTFKFLKSPICIQIVTRAKNPQTDEELDFPTPCDVPEGWEKIQPEQL
ncbi:MAG: hypothetical protein HY395_02730 [Candidatus Doudnabacteria bacterium]|nr:hypothetical protein [Candidatus Doudnabacteria bacterium]